MQRLLGDAAEAVLAAPTLGLMQVVGMHGEAELAVAAVEHDEVDAQALAVAEQAGVQLQVVQAENALESLQRHAARCLLWLTDDQAVLLVDEADVAVVDDQCAHGRSDNQVKVLPTMCPALAEGMLAAGVEPGEDQAILRGD
ncbi:hypothetical protein D3C84_706730 [compost metagenome]